MNMYSVVSFFGQKLLYTKRVQDRQLWVMLINFKLCQA